MNKLIKNLLVQYKGGGYDGCHWEWNYFMFNNRGEFIDLASSGRNGITNRKDAIELLEEKSDKHTFYTRYYKYNVKSKKASKEFVKETAETHVIEVGGMVNDLTSKNALKISMDCNDCGETIILSKKESNDYPQFIPTDYEGDGGTGLVYSEYVCTDCYCSHSCAGCGKYEPDINKLNEDHYCEYCV